MQTEQKAVTLAVTLADLERLLEAGKFVAIAYQGVGKPASIRRIKKWTNATGQRRGHNGPRNYDRAAVGAVQALCVNADAPRVFKAASILGFKADGESWQLTDTGLAQGYTLATLAELPAR